MRYFVACLVILGLTVGSWAQADEPLQPGGAVVVDGKTLPGCVYMTRGRAMFFPVLPIAQALGKAASFDAASKTLVFDGKAFTPEVIVLDNSPYLSWRELNKIAPFLRFGAGSGKAFFDSKALPTASHPPDPAKKPADKPTTQISILGQDLRNDPNRGNRLTIEAQFQNNTDKPIPNLVVALVLVDTAGVTGPSDPGGQGRTYDRYQQQMGTLGPSELRKMTFETSIVEPKDLDTGRQHLTIDLVGVSMSVTPVELTYRFEIGQTK